MGGGEGPGGTLGCHWHTDASCGGGVKPPGMIIDSDESDKPVVIETLEASGHSDIQNHSNHSNSVLLSSMCIVHETTFVLQSVSAFVSVFKRLGYSLYHLAITAIIITIFLPIITILIFIILVLHFNPSLLPLVSQIPYSFAQSGFGHHSWRHG